MSWSEGEARRVEPSDTERVSTEAIVCGPDDFKRILQLFACQGPTCVSTVSPGEIPGSLGRQKPGGRIDPDPRGSGATTSVLSTEFSVQEKPMAPSDNYMPDGCSAEAWVQNSCTIDAREPREQTLLREGFNGTFHAGPLNAIPEECGVSGEPMLIGNSEANESGVSGRDFRSQCSAAFSVVGETLPAEFAGLDPDDDELLPTEEGRGMRIASIGQGAGVSTRLSSRSGSDEGWLGILVQAAARGISPREARELLLGLPQALTGQLRCSQLRFASLMAGAGGRSMGYRLDSVGSWEGVAVEWNASFAAVHNANNQYDHCFEHKMTVEAPLPEGFQLGRPCHHMAAGPPCQPYSRAGKGLGARDERDGIPAVLKAIAILHPTIVHAVNSVGMVTSLSDYLLYDPSKFEADPLISAVHGTGRHFQQSTGWPVVQALHRSCSSSAMHMHTSYSRGPFKSNRSSRIAVDAVGFHTVHYSTYRSLSWDLAGPKTVQPSDRIGAGTRETRVVSCEQLHCVASLQA